MNPISGIATILKPLNIVRKPGSVKFVWDKRVIIYLLLAGAILVLFIGFYFYGFMMKPNEGYEMFLALWGTLLFSVIGDAVFIAIFLKMQGAILVNQTESKVEILKGLGLSNRIHSLRFDTLEKIIVTSCTPLATVASSAESQELYQQVGIYLKTGKEIELPFARLVPEEALKVVQEVAEAAGIPAFDSEGNPIHSPLTA